MKEKLSVDMAMRRIQEVVAKETPMPVKIKAGRACSKIPAMPLARLADSRQIRLGTIVLSVGRRSRGKGYHCDDHTCHRLCTSNPIRHHLHVSMAVEHMLNQMNRSFLGYQLLHQESQADRSEA